MQRPFSTAVILAVLLALHPLAHADVLRDHPGRWLGTLNIPGGPPLRLGADVFTRADGSVWASAASPDQDAYDIPVAGIREHGQTAVLDLSFAVLTLTWAGDRFTGEWKQGPAPLAFELKKTADFPRKARAQTPRAPFPYRTETLALPGADGVTLGATLSLPAGVARPTLVVLVGGSGPTTRDAGLAGHQSFAVLADYLARRGSAVLRYDKRGVSRSTGDYAQHTVSQLTGDLLEVVRALETRKQFRRIGLIGHSEGAHVAAAAAARRPGSVDFVVSMAGVGMGGLASMLAQDRLWALDHGATPEEADQAIDYAKNYYEIVLAHAEPGPRIAALEALYTSLPPERQGLIRKLEMNVGTLSLSWAEKPFVRATLQANPSAHWRAVRSPVLVLNGGLDRQVPAENLDAIVAALKSGGNQRVVSTIFPALNHLFQTASTGRDDEYARIDETLAPTALERIARFVKQQR